MKKLSIILLFIASAFSANSQDFLGYNYSNYQTAGGMVFNPASIADSRYRANINIFSLNAGLTNNAYEIRKRSITSSDGWSEEYDFKKINSTGTKDLNLNIDAIGPSFMLNLGKIGSIGISTRMRLFVDEKNLDNNIFQLFGNSDANYFNTLHKQDNLMLDVHAFADFGLTYARTVWNTENHVIKAGATGKYVIGAGGGSLRINNLQVELDDNFSEDMVKTLSGDITVVYSDGIDALINGNDNFFSTLGNESNGIGFDFGVEYEWYKDGKKVNPANSFWTKNITPYTLKASISITDIGSVKYNSSEYAKSYRINMANKPVSDLDFQSDWTFSEYFDYLKTEGILTPLDDLSSYKMNLPTVLRANIDWNAYKMIYVNAGTVLSLNGENKFSTRHANYVYITPRFEHKWISIYSPFSYSSQGTSHWGLGFNFGAFFVGSGSALSNLFSSNIKGVDAHFGFAVPIFKKNKEKKTQFEPDEIHQ